MKENETIKSGWRTVSWRMRTIAGGHTDQFTFADIKREWWEFKGHSWMLKSMTDFLYDFITSFYSLFPCPNLSLATTQIIFIYLSSTSTRQNVINRTAICFFIKKKKQIQCWWWWWWSISNPLESPSITLDIPPDDNSNFLFLVWIVIKDSCWWMILQKFQIQSKNDSSRVSGSVKQKRIDKVKSSQMNNFIGGFPFSSRNQITL